MLIKSAFKIRVALNEVIVCLRNIQQNIRASNELEELGEQARDNAAETPNKRRKGGKKNKNNYY